MVSQRGSPANPRRRYHPWTALGHCRRRLSFPKTVELLIERIILVCERVPRVAEG